MAEESDCEALVFLVKMWMVKTWTGSASPRRGSPAVAAPVAVADTGVGPCGAGPRMPLGKTGMFETVASDPTDVRRPYLAIVVVGPKNQTHHCAVQVQAQMQVQKGRAKQSDPARSCWCGVWSKCCQWQC